mgnify:CR=1 FL=1
MVQDAFCFVSGTTAIKMKLILFSASHLIADRIALYLVFLKPKSCAGIGRYAEKAFIHTIFPTIEQRYLGAVEGFVR